MTIVTRGYGVSGGGSGDPLVVSAEYIDGTLQLTFDRPIIVSAPAGDKANYSIEPPAGAQQPTIAAVAVTSSLVTLVLDQDELVDGGTYTLTMADKTLRADSDGGPNLSGAEYEFDGEGVDPTVQGVFPLNNVKIWVTFNESVRMVNAGHADDALNSSNYAISGGVTVTAVRRVDDVTVELTTTTQTLDHDYTLTTSNVEDIAGNPVAASSPHFLGGDTPAATIISVAVIDQAVLRVTFSIGLNVDANLYEPSNFVVNKRLGYAQPMYVKEVVPGTGLHPTYVDLLLRNPLTKKGNYNLGVTNIHDLLGRVISI